MLGRKLIAILCGAFAFAAVQFLAGSAFAHAGHHHSQAAHGVAAAHDHARHMLAAPALPGMMEVSADHSTDGSVPQDVPCKGACCSLQHSCCGGSFIASAPGLGFGPDHAKAALVRTVGSVSPGLDPDIPPKPPKTFA
jgi:hypothetical protein